MKNKRQSIYTYIHIYILALLNASVKNKVITH